MGSTVYTAVLSCRRLLLQVDADTFSDPNADRNVSSLAQIKPLDHRSLDSSMVLTILIVLTAMVFIGFFSVYLRRFSVGFNLPPPSSYPTVVGSVPPGSLAPSKDGIDSSIVRSLPLLAYGKAAKHPTIDDCPICLSEFQEKENLKLIPYCSHVFHPRCIDTWLLSHATCPVCRSSQLLRVEGEV